MAFCSGSVALHYSLPQIQTPSIIFLLDTANPRNLLAALDFRPELYLLESEEKKISFDRKEIQSAVKCIKEHIFFSIFELVLAYDSECNFCLK